MGEFPQSAIVVFNTEGTEDGTGYDNVDTIEEVWEIVDDKYTVKETCGSGIPRLRSPISGAYYPMGEFYFNVNMIAKEVYLCYILGPRYGRGFKYQIQALRLKYNYFLLPLLMNGQVGFKSIISQ